jgi:hypothetical protein
MVAGGLIVLQVLGLLPALLLPIACDAAGLNAMPA